MPLKIKPFVIAGSFLPCALAISASGPLSAYAADCNGTDTVIINCEAQGGQKVDGTWFILLLILNILAGGVGIVAVGGIAYAAFLYTTASDNESQLTKAKEIIFNTVLGVMAFALLYSFLQFIIPGGAFGSGGPVIAREAPKVARPATGGSNTSGSTRGTVSSADSAASAISKSTAKCYTVTTMTGTKIHGKMFHRFDNLSYAFENSPRGVEYAAKHGYTSIDLDTQVTKDGVVVVVHTGRPIARGGFYDPEGKIAKTRTVGSMTFAEISRLRHRDGISRIYHLDYMIKVLAANGVNLSLEIKDPISFKKHLPQITASLNKAGVKAYIKGEAPRAGMNDAFAAARNIGFWTRGTEGSQGWKAPTRCN